jgi:hypothetical protein
MCNWELIQCAAAMRVVRVANTSSDSKVMMIITFYWIFGTQKQFLTSFFNEKKGDRRWAPDAFHPSI